MAPAQDQGVPDAPGDTADNLAWEQMAPEERAFLVWFARNYVTGRRVMCWSAQAIVKIGAVAAAVAAILAALHQAFGLRPP